MHGTRGALHPKVLKMYHAEVLGVETRHGNEVHDLQFKSLHHATSWAATNDIEMKVALVNDQGGIGFDMPVVVRYIH